MMSARTSASPAGGRTLRPALFGRRWWHLWRPLAVLGFLVAAVAMMVATVPSAHTALTTAELSDTAADQPPTSRFLIGRTSIPRPVGETGAVAPLGPMLTDFTERLAQWRAELPQPLRGLVGEATLVITGPAMPLDTRDPASTPSGARQVMVTRFDPTAADRVEMVDGRWPDGQADPAAPRQMSVSAETAAAMAWTVGGSYGGYLLTGTFRARDSADDYWALNPSMLQPDVFDDGNQSPRITATGFIDEATYARASTPTADAVLVAFPLALGQVPGGRLTEVIDELRGATARSNRLAVGDSGGGRSLQVTAAAIPALQDVSRRLADAGAILTVAAAGPLGVAVVVLGLGVLALLARQRPTVVWLRARGASGWWLRADRAAQALLIALPAAALACWAVALRFGPDTSVTGLAVGLAVGVVVGGAPAAGSLGPAPQRAVGADRRRNRLALALGATICLLAVTSCYLLVRTGVGTGAGSGVDALVVAAPLLLAAAACVVVGWIAPFPLRWIVGRARRGPRLVSLIGATRLLRAPSTMLAAALAVVIGVSVAVFSAITLSTLTAATTTAALAEVGAAVRAEGGPVSDESLTRVRAVPGVSAAARVQRVGRTQIGSGILDQPDPVDLVVADAAALHEVLAESGLSIDFPVVAASAGLPGLVTSPDVGRVGDRLVVRGQPFVIEATVAGVAPVTGAARWALADGDAVRSGTFRSDILLVSVAAGGDPQQVAERLPALIGAADVSTAAGAAADRQRAPIFAGLRTLLVAGTLATALGAAAAVVMTMVAATPGRARTLAIMRVLGVPLGDRRRVVVWEQAPAVLTATVVGAAVGIGVTVLVRHAFDLRSFTGGAAPPPLSVDPLALAVLLGGFLAVLVLAIGVGLLLTRRTTAAAVFRLDEEFR